MNNGCFIYEDTFLSLLNLIHYLLKNAIKPDKIKNTSYSPNLFDEVVHLTILEEKEIFNKVIQLIGSYATRALYYVFLSNEENKELILYYLLLNGQKYKDKILFHRHLRCVSETIRISNYVIHEVHKYKGFVRFQELENHILYAEVEPVNDVLELIAPHFKKRLKNDYWIIKDVRRNRLSLYDKKNYYLVSGHEFSLETTLKSHEEQKVEELWKAFYKTIGIQERKNERCRMNFMPKKYWKYMLEMEDEL